MYDPTLHVVLFQPEIPQNTGNVGRTCVAAGAKLWLIRPLGFRTDESRLRRAGMDYWQRLNWEALDSWDAFKERHPTGRFWMFTKTARTPYLEAQFNLGDILVFGNESSGLPPSILTENASQTLRIPMRSDVRSLNLASTVAVAVYEATRQLIRANLVKLP